MLMRIAQLSLEEAALINLTLAAAASYLTIRLARRAFRVECEQGETTCALARRIDARTAEVVAHTLAEPPSGPHPPLSAIESAALSELARVRVQRR